VMLFDGHEPALSLRLLDRAEREGIRTILDAGSFHQGTSQLYDKVDFLVCSHKFAAAIAGADDQNEALEILSQHNKNVVITLGDRGLVWKTEEGTGALPAFPVDAVDNTGAGDVFHGAFAGCIAQGKTWDDTLRYASAAAALSCTKPGGRTSIPTIEQVETFLTTEP
jgi:sulfofructose kinase